MQHHIRYLNIVLLVLTIGVVTKKLNNPTWPVSSSHHERKLASSSPPETTESKLTSTTEERSRGSRKSDDDPDILDEGEDDIEEYVDYEERCIPVDECVICDNLKKLDDECDETWRRQKFECISGNALSTVYRSCKRTVQDEEWLMLRLQMICSLLAMISLMSTRRQKRVSASLFDQRRKGARGRRGGGDGDSVTTDDTESTPLTTNQSLGDTENV